MKLKPTLAASLFAILAALSLNAGAEAHPSADAKIEEVVPQMDKAAAQKAMRPHSHVAEKLGFAPKAPETMSEKPNAAKDRTKHFHPRDGK